MGGVGSMCPRTDVSTFRCVHGSIIVRVRLGLWLVGVRLGLGGVSVRLRGYGLD